MLTFHIGSYLRPFSDPLGYAAVDLFFLLSGCVIEASYGDKLRSGTSLLRFARIRLARLYPLYILGTGIMLLAITAAPHGRLFLTPGAWFTIPRPLALCVPAVFFIPLLNAVIAYPLNPPAWSLFWEIVVNLLYVVLLPHLNRKTLALIVAVAGVPLVIVNSFGYHHAASTFPLGLARVSFSFFLGVLIYRERGVLPPAPRLQPWLTGLAVAIVCITLSWQSSTPGTYLVAVLLAFPVAVCLALHVEPGIGTARLFDRLGDISYPIYAIHVPLALLVLAITGPVAPALWMGAAFSIAMCVLAVGLNRYYDRPLRNWLMSNTKCKINPS